MFFAYFCGMLKAGLSISFWQQLEEWDKWLFLKINNQWTNPFFDFILPYFRDSVFWAPLYLFVVVFMMVNFGQKGMWWSLAFLGTVIMADTIGAKVFKEGFERLRPCNDPDFYNNVRLLLKRCAGGYSFTSNHAANHFGLASFVVFTFRSVFKSWIYLAYLWAFSVSYAQIYVGVHYPTDIMGGALLGFLSGAFFAWLFRKKEGTFNLDNIIT